MQNNYDYVMMPMLAANTCIVHAELSIVCCQTLTVLGCTSLHRSLSSPIVDVNLMRKLSDNQSSWLGVDLKLVLLSVRTYHVYCIAQWPKTER